MTYDPNFRNDFDKDNLDDGPSPMGALGFLVALFLILGGAAFFFGRSDVNTVANQMNNSVQPPITQPETTGSGSTAR